MTLLLMAAGSGSRYGKLKQFDGLGPKEEFLMEFSIYDAIQCGFTHIVVITKKENVTFLNNHLSSRLPEHIQLHVVAQELTDLPLNSHYAGDRKKPWGTAHAVWSARHVIQGPFAVLNADDFYGASAYKNAFTFGQRHANDTMHALIGFTLKDTLSKNGPVSRGICEVADDFLIAVHETLKLEHTGPTIVDHDTKKTFTGLEMVSMNFWICKPSIFSIIEKKFRAFLKDEQRIATSELYLPVVIQEMLQANDISVKVIPSDDNWFGITYAYDKEKAMVRLQEMTEKKQYPTPLWT